MTKAVVNIERQKVYNGLLSNGESVALRGNYTKPLDQNLFRKGFSNVGPTGNRIRDVFNQRPQRKRLEVVMMIELGYSQLAER